MVILVWCPRLLHYIISSYSRFYTTWIAEVGSSGVGGRAQILSRMGAAYAIDEAKTRTSTYIGQTGIDE